MITCKLNKPMIEQNPSGKFDSNSDSLSFYGSCMSITIFRKNLLFNCILNQLNQANIPTQLLQYSF
jgi:hypothetical protein